MVLCDLTKELKCLRLSLVMFAQGYIFVEDWCVFKNLCHSFLTDNCVTGNVDDLWQNGKYPSGVEFQGNTKTPQKIMRTQLNCLKISPFVSLTKAKSKIMLVLKGRPFQTAPNVASNYSELSSPRISWWHCDWS